MEFNGANTIVTGGSSGIGKAAAKQLAQGGANVFIVARDQARLDAALKEIESERVNPEQRLGAFQADVGVYEEVEGAIARIVQVGGPPDILINSAGTARPGYFEKLPLSVFRDAMDTNYFGTVHAIKAILPHLMPKGGHIANVSSAAGFMGVFGYTAYGASKFAVLGLSEALRSELKPYGIGVSVLVPVDTDTPQLWEENKYKPLETKVTEGVVRPDELKGPQEHISYRLANLFYGSTEPAAPEQVAAALLRGIRRGDYLIVPDIGVKALFYVGRVLAPLVNWVFDHLVIAARRQRGVR